MSSLILLNKLPSRMLLACPLTLQVVPHSFVHIIGNENVSICKQLSSRLVLMFSQFD